MSAVVAIRERGGGGGGARRRLDEQALATAGMAASPNTRRAGATAYRVFAEVLRVRYGEASGGKVTIASVAASRVGAVRRLAATLGPTRSYSRRLPHVQRDQPRALSGVELARLLYQPGRRAVIGSRDPAIVELLARAGLMRAELAHLTAAVIQERGRQPDARGAPRSRPAAQTRSRWWWSGRPSAGTRTVPLHVSPRRARTLVCPPANRRRATRCSSACATGARPEAISVSAVGDVVVKHAAGAGIRADRRTAHALRHISARCSPRAACRWRSSASSSAISAAIVWLSAAIVWLSAAILWLASAQQGFAVPPTRSRLQPASVV